MASKKSNNTGKIIWKLGTFAVIAFFVRELTKGDQS